MKKIVVVFAVAVLVANVLVSSGQDGKEPKKRERNPIMQKKLEHSQKVLEGIAVADFRLIEQNAEELILLSKKAEWMVLQTPEYTLQSNDFRRNAETVIEKAKAKNLDGAVLAYVQLTMNCVECHKHVREIRRASIDIEDDRLFAYAIGRARK